MNNRKWNNIRWTTVLINELKQAVVNNNFKPYEGFIVLDNQMLVYI